MEYYVITLETRPSTNVQFFDEYYATTCPERSSDMHNAVLLSSGWNRTSIEIEPDGLTRQKIVVWKSKQEFDNFLIENQVICDQRQLEYKTYCDSVNSTCTSSFVETA